VALAYAEDAIGDSKRAKYCEWVRLAAKRFVRDLKRAAGKRPPFYFSPDRANLHCEFIECLPHVEGRWTSPTIVLIPAQIFFIVNLFGFRNLNGGRRFTSALLAVARKNAKSTLASAILLSCLCLENELGPQVLSAATTGQQARIIFNVAKRMVEKLADLRSEFDLEPFANAIARYETGGTFKPINAKASTQDGLNPSHTGIDEIHAHKTHDLLNVLTSAAGARDNPLWLFTTTEGYESPGPWPETRAYAQSILRGLVDADHFLALLYMLDEDDDDFDESKWVKANPLMEVNPLLMRENRKLALEAKSMPGKLPEFRIKRLNRQSATARGEINLTKWRRCSRRFTIDDMKGLPCMAALDLASTMDMNSWRLLWHDPDEDFYFTAGRFWVPKGAVQQRSERNTVNYVQWIERGYVEQTEGDTTDYEVIEAAIIEDFGMFAPTSVAYDPWNAAATANRLTDQGVPMLQFTQGPRSYAPAIDAMEIAYTRGNFSHGGDPVLLWQAANLVCRKDANLNRAPDRKRAADKIDGMVTLAMAFGLFAATTDQGDVAGFFNSPVVVHR
jgi:phage terminase large subunit-like protein